MVAVVVHRDDGREPHATVTGELADLVVEVGGPERCVHLTVWDPESAPGSWSGPPTRAADQPLSRSSSEATTAATNRSRAGAGRRSSDR